VSNKLHERLKEIAKECGGNRALCEKSGVSERTFANWLAGSSEPKVIGISSIANAAGVTIDWLVTGTKPKLKLGARESDAAQVVQIALIGGALETGSGPSHQRFQIRDHIPFSQEFLTQKLGKTDFDQLCIIEVQGDSMAPTMNNGDFALIDRQATSANDGLNAYVFKDSLYIKRFVHTLNGIDIVSDNQSLYPTQRISGEDLESLEILGSVLWVGKTVL
jgi:phage repressor protein C with HTH and peptisase S24 domain